MLFRRCDRGAHAERVGAVMSELTVRSAVQRLAWALLDDVERIAERSVARMQELLPSYANVPADALIPVTLMNTRNLLGAVRDPDADLSHADDHFRVSGETRLGQGITADEMLQAWQIGLEVVREEAHPVATRLAVTDAGLLEFVEATLQWGDVGMRRSAAAHRAGEIRDLERLTAEQAALRRVAMMVARESSPTDVFAKVAEELSRLHEVDIARLVRFEPDGTAAVLAAHGITDDRLTRGAKFPIPHGSVFEKVLHTGRPARVDDFAEVEGPIGAVLREQGARAGVGGPIVVDGRLWGAMAVGARSFEALPPGSEDRVAQFAELVSTAISNLESRARVEQLAAEQSALRRVAELVARQAPSAEVLALVTEELSSLLGVKLIRTVRFEEDGSTTVLASLGKDADGLPPGTNAVWPTGSVTDQVLRTGRPARLDDYAPLRGPVAAILREEGVRCAVGGPIIVDGRTWGAMVVASDSTENVPPGSEDRVARFTELVSTAISNLESRARVEQLAAEQAALRRVAELVARQAPPDEVFGLVTEELNRLLDVTTVGTGRFESDGTVTIMAVRGTAQDAFPPGTSVALEGGSAIEQVFHTGRPAHIENYDSVGGQLGDVMRKLGAGWATAGPIVVDGRLWGAMTVKSDSAGAYPAGAEQRVAQFAELVSTAISNIESRAKVERLAAEQAALRRVTELVARQAPAERVFAVVTEELSRLLYVDMVRLVRFEPDGTATVLAARGMVEDPIPPGTNAVIPSGSVIDQVSRTSRPARVDDYAKVGGRIGSALRDQGAGSAAGGPIVVDGRLWGAMVACRTAETLPAGSEGRVAQFAELVSTAISNIESRDKVERLAAEQSALRRVATIVARTPASERLFSIVALEVASVLDVPGVIVTRYDADGMATTLGEAFRPHLAGAERFLGVGTRMPRRSREPRCAGLRHARPGARR